MKYFIFVRSGQIINQVLNNDYCFYVVKLMELVMKALPFRSGDATGLKGVV